MTERERLEEAKYQLETVLGFFARVDAKSSVVLGIDTGMLAFLAANLPKLSFFTTTLGVVDAIAGVASLCLIGASLTYIYLQVKPTLEGGANSLVYFRSIASRTEHDYIRDFNQQDMSNRIDDSLGQVWRNSEILTTKFANVEISLKLLAFATPFWLFSLGVSIIQNVCGRP